MPKQKNNYLKYSSLGFQMLVIIIAGVYSGMKLDEHYNLANPVFTIILSFLGFIISFYILIKDISKK